MGGRAYSLCRITDGWGHWSRWVPSQGAHASNPNSFKLAAMAASDFTVSACERMRRTNKCTRAIPVHIRAFTLFISHLSDSRHRALARRYGSEVLAPKSQLFSEPYF